MRFLTATFVLTAVVAVRADAADKTTMPEVIESLRHGDRKSRSQVLWGMTYDCAACRPVVPALIEVFREGDAELRESALERLAEVGPAAEEAVPSLKEALRSGNAADLPLVAQALWSIERRIETVAPTIHALLADDPDEVMLPGWRETSEIERQEIRYSTIRVVWKMGSAAKPFARHLARAIDDDDPKIRRRAADALAGIAPDISRDVVPSLEAALKHDDRKVVVPVAEALWVMGAPAEQLVPVLIEILETPEKKPRKSGAILYDSPAGRLLKKMEPEAKAAVPTFIKRLAHEQYGIAIGAADALGSIGPEAADAIAALDQALRRTEVFGMPFVHHSWCVSRNAGAALGRIGPASTDVLLKATKDKVPMVRGGAVEALRQLPPSDAIVQSLTMLLDDKETYVRALAAYALGEMGLPSKRAVELLVPMLEDMEQWDYCPGASGICSTYTVRHHAWEALLAIGPRAKHLTPALVGVMQNTKGIDYEVARLLRSLGPAAADAVPIVERFLDDPENRVPAAYALARIAPDHPGVLPVLTEACLSMEWMHVPMGTQGLSDLGKKARSAVPKLLTIIGQPEDRDLEFSVLIAATILRIDPDNRAAIRVFVEDFTHYSWLTNEQTSDMLAMWSRLGNVRQSATAILEAGLVHEKKEKYTDEIDDWEMYRSWEAGIRLRSARLLIAMPQQASKLVTPLIRLCEHEDPEVRAVAAKILSQLPSPPEAVIERLRKLIPDDHSYSAGGDFYGTGSGEFRVGEQAAQALAQIGVRAVPALRRTLKDGSFRARCRAAGGLASLGPDAKPATADLIDGLEDPTPGIRVAAAKALAQIANDNDRAIEALIKALNDQRLGVRIATATALGRSPAQANTVRALYGALADDYLRVRIAAADSLARFGPKAQTAAPFLKKMLQDKYPTAQHAAADALKRIVTDNSTSTGR